MARSSPARIDAIACRRVRWSAYRFRPGLSEGGRESSWTGRRRGRPEGPGRRASGRALRQRAAGTTSAPRRVDAGLGSVPASTNRKVGLAAGSLVPPGVVTVMATAPEPAGVTAVILESLSTLKLIAWTVPKLTPVAAVNPLPLMVTWLPPAFGPKLGFREATTGRAANLNRSPGPAALVPAGVVTVTSTVPAFSAGEVAVIWVLLSTVNEVAATLPKFTAVAPPKAVPAIVTEAPP